MRCTALAASVLLALVFRAYGVPPSVTVTLPDCSGGNTAPDGRAVCQSSVLVSVSVGTGAGEDSAAVLAARPLLDDSFELEHPIEVSFSYLGTGVRVGLDASTERVFNVHEAVEPAPGCAAGIAGGACFLDTHERPPPGRVPRSEEFVLCCVGAGAENVDTTGTQRCLRYNYTDAFDSYRVARLDVTHKVSFAWRAGGAEAADVALVSDAASYLQFWAGGASLAMVPLLDGVNPRVYLDSVALDSNAYVPLAEGFSATPGSVADSAFFVRPESSPSQVSADEYASSAACLFPRNRLTGQLPGAGNDQYAVQRERTVRDEVSDASGGFTAVGAVEGSAAASAVTALTYDLGGWPSNVRVVLAFDNVTLLQG